MASFEIAYERVADAEGGYQKLPNDRGNKNSLGQLVGTNWGINAQVYESWIGRPPSESDMRNMSKGEAKEIYRVKYWTRVKGDDINNQFIGDIFFDGHVNHGFTGIKIMQRILGIPDDGVVGPVTLGAINNANPANLYNQYKQARINFYFRLAEDPSQKGFLDGWLNRMDTFQDYPELVTENSNSNFIGFGLLAGLLIWRYG